MGTGLVATNEDKSQIAFSLAPRSDRDDFDRPRCPRQGCRPVPRGLRNR